MMNFTNSTTHENIRRSGIFDEKKIAKNIGKEAKMVKNIFYNKKQNVGKDLQDYQETMIKNAIINNIISKQHIQRQIYTFIINLKGQKWQNLPYLNSRRKREVFIEKIKQEIVDINKKNYNFKKYKSLICDMLGISQKNKFNESTIKNMYTVKLQNIIIIINAFDTESKNNIEEVKSSSVYLQ